MANEFKKTVGSEVPKKEALKWIEKYDNDHRRDKGKDTKSIFFGSEMIRKILDQPGCTGISFFLGLKHSDYAKKETVNLVLVGRLENGTLLWPDIDGGKDGPDGFVGDTGLPCPPDC